MLNYAKKAYWFFRERTRNFLRDTVVDTVKPCTVRGHKLKIGLSNPLEGYRIATYETKEPETLDWIELSLHANDVFFDIGANIGLYSVFAAKVQPKAKVYAFEPSIPNFSRLFRNMLNNGITNMTPMNLAVSGTTMLDYFHMSEWLNGAALHGFGGKFDFAQDKPSNIPLKYGTFGISLDDLVYKHGLPHPNLVKLDVDSIEEQIIKGGNRVLSDPSCRSVLVEVLTKEGELGHIHSLLSAHGFKQVLVSDWSVKNGEFTARNYIFSK